MLRVANRTDRRTFRRISVTTRKSRTAWIRLGSQDRSSTTSAGGQSDGFGTRAARFQARSTSRSTSRSTNATATSIRSRVSEFSPNSVRRSRLGTSTDGRAMRKRAPWLSQERRRPPMQYDHVQEGRFQTRWEARLPPTLERHEPQGASERLRALCLRNPARC